MSETLSLLELNSLVRKSLIQCLPDEYWVQAELSDVRAHSSGHCYLEFIQKDPRTNQLIAKARGNIWSNVFKLLKPYFENSTGQTFCSGIKVLVKVVVEFHELYGYSLNVYDIDPAYTLGDMENRRREILKKLEEDGVLELNKELVLPLLPQRIAVISSATAAGYDDFRHQLENNVRGYYFRTELFPAIMQGNQVEDTILSALDHINSKYEEFDVVVIIRGGGATSDLSGFDTYMLAASCAQFPLPIITGIGHERDDTILDMIAHTRVKTPTAAAEFLISRVEEAAGVLYSLADRINSSVMIRLNNMRRQLVSLTNLIPSASFSRLSVAKLRLLTIRKDLTQSVSSELSKQKYRLNLIQQRVKDASPETLLKRGYSITLLNGKVIKDSSEVQDGDTIITRLEKGEITSVVREKE